MKAEYPFNSVLQARTVLFLKSLKPRYFEHGLATKLVKRLAPSSAGSPSGFVESILTLVSSPHSNVVAAVLSFLYKITSRSSSEIRFLLVKSDLITNIFAAIQPQTLPIQGNEGIFSNLIWTLDELSLLAGPSSQKALGVTDAVNQYNHREMIFQKVVLPSSLFMTFLISNRYFLNGGLFKSFIDLLGTFIRIGPFHRPTLEFVLASPIAMAFSGCLSFFEDDHAPLMILTNIHQSRQECEVECPEVAQSGKRIMQALISEGIEDKLEQMLKHDKNKHVSNCLVQYCHSISTLLGANVPWL
ncbi:hypothetical protein BLNAU_24022 [Blattamonas nauphoetae]|uniref:Uncharacterized protein n=1 Tax=Blattamonas nauphoetae TaxID=2049346 RepID=A0ABQ9WNM4_9EUKA|nr:hypothetical protein BLNAU_24022 [Blattamonas nauphoetae]